MKPIALLFFVGISFLYTSFVAEAVLYLSLGENRCKLATIGNTKNIAAFVSLHDDENTSVEAFRSVQAKMPDITLYEISQSGDRLLRFKLNKKDFSFDPNRIFTNTGIQKTLEKYNGRTFPPAVIQGVSRFSDSLLRTIRPAGFKGYIVAIHNNTNGNLSVSSYQQSSDAAAVFASNKADIDDFLLVTSKKDFDYFKAQNINVVLQSEKAEDDGSMSVYCQRNQIPYINIEAQHGHLQEQMQLMQAVYTYLKTK